MRLLPIHMRGQETGGKISCRLWVGKSRAARPLSQGKPIKDRAHDAATNQSGGDNRGKEEAFVYGDIATYCARNHLLVVDMMLLNNFSYLMV